MLLHYVVGTGLADAEPALKMAIPQYRGLERAVEVPSGCFGRHSWGPSLEPAPPSIL